jgi:hypothetical protein
VTHLLVTFPAETKSTNVMLSEHWAKRASRAKAHRLQAWAELRALKSTGIIVGPVAVTLTRIAPRKLDDDNLRGAMKHIRDGVADWLEIDDGDDRIQWLYGQEKGPAAVRIEVKA